LVCHVASLYQKQRLLNELFLSIDEAFTSENWIVSLIPHFDRFPFSL
jgi:hypothetical protein